EDRRPRQGRPEPRVCGAQDRAVLHVEREADGSPVVAARHELAQDLDVVVLGVEEAFVERLLERHHHRRDRARDPASQARLPHRSRMSVLLPWYNRRLHRPWIQRTVCTTSNPRCETRCAKSSANRSTSSLACCSQRSTATISAIST